MEGKTFIAIMLAFIVSCQNNHSYHVSSRYLRAPIVAECNLPISAELYRKVISCPLIADVDTLFSLSCYYVDGQGTSLKDLNRGDYWLQWKWTGYVIDNKRESLTPIARIIVTDGILSVIVAARFDTDEVYYMLNIDNGIVVSASLLGALSLDKNILRNHVYEYFFSTVNNHELALWSFAPKYFVDDSGDYHYKGPYSEGFSYDNIKELFIEDYFNGTSDYFLRADYTINRDGTINVKDKNW